MPGQLKLIIKQWWGSVVKACVRFAKLLSEPSDLWSWTTELWIIGLYPGTELSWNWSIKPSQPAAAADDIDFCLESETGEVKLQLSYCLW